MQVSPSLAVARCQIGSSAAPMSPGLRSSQKPTTGQKYRLHHPTSALEGNAKTMNMDRFLARSLRFCFGSVNGLSYSARRVLWQRMNQIPLADSKHRIFEYANSHISKGQPVDYFEFGVGGGTFRFWLELNRCHESRFYGFDTFTGLPEERERFGEHAFSTP